VEDWFWWIDESRSEDNHVGPIAGFKHRNQLSHCHCYLLTERIEVNDVKLRVIGIDYGVMMELRTDLQ
jgi:hypothetical protein